ncbi:hypothetical protein ACH4MY_36425 [Streptomyces sp. NPDC017246]
METRLGSGVGLVPGAAVRAFVRAGEAGHSTVGIVLAAVALALMPLPMI